jgi:hypothetical protein
VSGLRHARREATRHTGWIVANLAERITPDELSVFAAARTSEAIRKLIRRVGLPQAAVILRAESDRRQHAARVATANAGEAPAGNPEAEIGS